MKEESLNFTNTDLLIRFNKIREIFPSATQVLSILLTTKATSKYVKRANSKERVPKGSRFEPGCQLCAEISSLQQ